MASAEKKIQVGGYSHYKFGQMREAISRFWQNDIEEVERFPRKKKNTAKYCHKLKGPHDYVIIKLPEHERWKNWTDFQCTACRRHKYEFHW